MNWQIFGMCVRIRQKYDFNGDQKLESIVNLMDKQKVFINETNMSGELLGVRITIFPCQ